MLENTLSEPKCMLHFVVKARELYPVPLAVLEFHRPGENRGWRLVTCSPTVYPSLTPVTSLSNSGILEVFPRFCLSFPTSW